MGRRRIRAAVGRTGQRTESETDPNQFLKKRGKGKKKDTNVFMFISSA